jgi:hypothetical protein
MRTGAYWRLGLVNAPDRIEPYSRQSEIPRYEPRCRDIGARYGNTEKIDRESSFIGQLPSEVPYLERLPSAPRAFN